MTDERKQAEEYPETIFATEKIGSNGIDCLDYRNYDEDVEYIRADIMSLKVAEATKEMYPKEYITWLFKEVVWTDCTGFEPITQIEIDDMIYTIEEAFEYWKQNISK